MVTDYQKRIEEILKNDDPDCCMSNHHNAINSLLSLLQEVRSEALEAQEKCDNCSPAPNKMIKADNVYNPICTKCGKDLLTKSKEKDNCDAQIFGKEYHTIDCLKSNPKEKKV